LNNSYVMVLNIGVTLHINALTAQYKVVWSAWLIKHVYLAVQIDKLWLMRIGSKLSLF
jgi:hypothetical protein